MPVPRLEALEIARLVETSNAESPTMMIYNQPVMAVRIYTSHRASLVALFLTNRLNFPDSKTSKPKRTVTPFYVNVCPPPLPAGLRRG